MKRSFRDLTEKSDREGNASDNSAAQSTTRTERMESPSPVAPEYDLTVSSSDDRTTPVKKTNKRRRINPLTALGIIEDNEAQHNGDGHVIIDLSKSSQSSDSSNSDEDSELESAMSISDESDNSKSERQMKDSRIIKQSSSDLSIVDLERLSEALEQQQFELQAASSDGTGIQAAGVIADKSRPLRERLGFEPAMEWPFSLDAFQVEGIRHLHCGDNILVTAHTSAGKTVLAEYSIARALSQNAKCVYTCPIKALSNQKFRDLSDTFGTMMTGDGRQASVGLLTGDVQKNADNGDILVMTTEILRAMLYSGKQSIMREVSVVIFDEVHYMCDLSRGVVWEECIVLLCKLVRKSRIQLVFLSATLSNAQDFADWVTALCSFQGYTGGVIPQLNEKNETPKTKELTLMDKDDDDDDDGDNEREDDGRETKKTEDQSTSEEGIKCHVVSTNFRPVPLHFHLYSLYCCSNGASPEECSKSLFRLKSVDSIDGSLAAVQSRVNGSPNALKRRRCPDLNELLEQVIIDRDWTPAIVFLFSRRQVEMSARKLAQRFKPFKSHSDFDSGRRKSPKPAESPKKPLLTEEQQEAVEMVFMNAISAFVTTDQHSQQLSEKKKQEEQQKQSDEQSSVDSLIPTKPEPITEEAQPKERPKLMPSFELVLSLLKCGIGIHHSGMVPVLKEVVELLLNEGLVKVLFATETFAMGVNMPARCVVFGSIVKFDGISHRVLKCGEAIQMAGRSGRRGTDKQGYVIFAVDSESLRMTPHQNREQNHESSEKKSDHNQKGESKVGKSSSKKGKSDTNKDESESTMESSLCLLLKQIFNEQSEPLISSFRLTYNTILNSFRQGDSSVLAVQSSSAMGVSGDENGSVVDSQGKEEQPQSISTQTTSVMKKQMSDPKYIGVGSGLMSAQSIIKHSFYRYLLTQKIPQMDETIADLKVIKDEFESRSDFDKVSEYFGLEQQYLKYQKCFRSLVYSDSYGILTSFVDHLFLETGRLAFIDLSPVIGSDAMKETIEPNKKTRANTDAISRMVGSYLRSESDSNSSINLTKSNSDDVSKFLKSDSSATDLSRNSSSIVASDSSMTFTETGQSDLIIEGHIDSDAVDSAADVAAAVVGGSEDDSEAKTGEERSEQDGSANNESMDIDEDMDPDADGDTDMNSAIITEDSNEQKNEDDQQSEQKKEDENKDDEEEEPAILDLMNLFEDGPDENGFRRTKNADEKLAELEEERQMLNGFKYGWGIILRCKKQYPSPNLTYFVDVLIPVQRHSDKDSRNPSKLRDIDPFFWPISEEYQKKYDFENEMMSVKLLKKHHKEVALRILRVNVRCVSKVSQVRLIQVPPRLNTLKSRRELWSDCFDVSDQGEEFDWRDIAESSMIINHPKLSLWNRKWPAVSSKQQRSGFKISNKKQRLFEENQCRIQEQIDKQLKPLFNNLKKQYQCKVLNLINNNLDQDFDYDLRRLYLQYNLAQRKYDLLREKRRIYRIGEFAEELSNKRELLRSLGYIEGINVTPKGQVACSMECVDELLMSELIFEGFFSDCSSVQCAVLLSALLEPIVKESAKKPPSFPELELKSDDSRFYLNKLQMMREIDQKLSLLKSALKISDNASMSGGSSQCGITVQWLPIVNSWMNGISFAQLTAVTECVLFPGNLIRSLKRLDDLLRESCEALSTVGERELCSKLSEAATTMRRGVPFAASLYVENLTHGEDGDEDEQEGGESAESRDFSDEDSD